MSALGSNRSQPLVAAAAVAMLGLAIAACGRSSDVPVGPGSPTSAIPASASASAQASGTFGSLTKVCAPGPGTGGSGRGISGKTIHIGVLSDTGSSVEPGLGQEFFDTADAFVKWCNAAGGINGRTIVVDKLDAALFNGAQEVLKACQDDFMLVGGGNALDAPDVKPRVACKLGQIPGYTVSPEATAGALQVSPAASVATSFPIGPMRLLAAAYPATQQGLGIAGSSLASLAPQGLRAQEAWEKLGYKVSTLQPRPALVDNYRPYMEQLKSSGAKADYEITTQDPSPIFTAMANTGFNPQWVLFSPTFYSPKSIQAAKAASYLPTSYVSFQNLPFELAGQYPVVQQVKDIMAAGSSTTNLDNFTALGFNAWTLWAQAATACGDNLTQTCVLQKAAAHTAWTAGGLFAPVNTDPAKHTFTDCTLVVRITRTGFVYDKKVTQPNNGPYNCSPQNLVPVKSYVTSS